MERKKPEELEGEAKDIEGRAERQGGEWTGDREAQLRGAATQAEGKMQKGWGKLKEQKERLQSQIKPRSRAPKKAA